MRSHQFRFPLLCLAAWASSYVLAAGASSEPDETDSIVDLPEMTVEGRAENLVGRAMSGSEGVVARPELDLRPYLRTGEILENVPGMIVTQHSGAGKANQYFLRGFNLDHGTDFSADLEGMPLNQRTHAHGQGYLDLNLIIPELVRRMEYEKGNHSVVSGDFSSAGQVSFQLFDELPTGFVSVGVGENGFYRLAAGDSYEAGKGTFLGAVELQSYDGPWDRPENFGKANVMLRYSSDIRNGKFSLLGMAYNASWDSTDQIPQRAVDSGLISRLGNIDDTVGGNSSRYSLQGTWSWADSMSQASVFASRYDLDLWSNFTYLLEDPVAGDQFEQSEYRWIFGGQAHHHWDTEFGERSLFQTVGAEARIDVIPEIGLFWTQARERRETIREDDITQSSVAAYWDGEIQLTDRFKVSGGIRGDYYWFDVNSDLAANSGREDDGILSPKLSAAYRVSDGVEMYASTGLGFHSNDARGTTISIDPLSGDPVDPVDPLVRSSSSELGIRLVSGNKFNSSIAVWMLDLDSELVYVGDAGTTEAGRPSARRGIEWSSHYRPKNWLTFDLDVSLTHARFDDDDPAGDYIPGSLDTVVAGGASVNLPEGWFGAARLRYFGERPLIEDNSVRSDPTTMVDLRIGWSNDNWRFMADVLNVFDSKDHDITYFYGSRLSGEPAEGVEDIHFHPVEPRTVRLYAEYWF